MFVLPTEVQLDVLKYLNFNQLFSFKLTNFYFYNLINKYEGELARMKLNTFYFINGNPALNLYDIIEPQSGIFELTLNDQLKNKWQEAIDRSIPLFLHEYKPDRTFVGISTVDKKRLLLKLPNCPKNIKEMIIVRYWVGRLLNCVYGQIHLASIVFNPEIINILFDNKKTIPPQFHFESLFMDAENKIFENVMKFVSNHLTISKFLYISFYSFDITEQNTNILFNILTNEGNKLPKIYLKSFKLARLYDLIMEYITTSINCSRMVPHIIFSFSTSASSRFKFSERAEKIEVVQLDKRKHTNYQIFNTYNPKVKFTFCNEEWNGGIHSCIHIKRM
uniref:F-box domain-containing protein n=1 Tax=Meloidogyne enterolobii TaxID=390850 RepID=A0A6V7XLA1_MELEN|nr:unnamed protein product [Meloidogyne enterolobii]